MSIQPFGRSIYNIQNEYFYGFLCVSKILPYIVKTQITFIEGKDFFYIFFSTQLEMLSSICS